jgi:hypothetical protein
MKAVSYLTLSATEKHSDIIFAELSDPIKVDLAVAKEIVASRLSFTGNQSHYLIVDISKVQSVTAEAKEYLQKPEGGLKNILGAALVASNPVSALIANIFIKTPKNFHARFFANKADAINWVCENRSRMVPNTHN